MNLFSHAVYTLVSTIVPSMFPNLTFEEVGIYLLPGEASVSPDGVLKRGDMVHYAVEIKCPTCADERYMTPVHYDVPFRYLSQVLLEGHVTNAKYGTIYMSWSTNSCTLFLVPRNYALEEQLVVACKRLGKKPTKLPKNVREIRQELKLLESKIEFLGEFPSQSIPTWYSTLSHHDSDKCAWNYTVFWFT